MIEIKLVPRAAKEDFILTEICWEKFVRFLPVAPEMVGTITDVKNAPGFWGYKSLLTTAMCGSAHTATGLAVYTSASGKARFSPAWIREYLLSARQTRLLRGAVYNSYGNQHAQTNC